MSKETEQLQRIVEGALMAAGKPLNVQNLIDLFDEDIEEVPTKDQIKVALEDIQHDCTGRGFELKEIASGYRFQVIQEVAPWVSRMWDEKPQKYSRALLETLSLIAYRQPITRGDIEDIRGVAVSSHIIKTLSEREWVRVVGHKDVPGRPALFATTRSFLDYFNLKNLDELPSLAEIRDLENMNEELALEGVDTPDPEVVAGEGNENSIQNEGASVNEEPSAEDLFDNDEPPADEDSSANEDISTEDSMASETVNAPIETDDITEQSNYLETESEQGEQLAESEEAGNTLEAEAEAEAEAELLAEEDTGH